MTKLTALIATLVAATTILTSLPADAYYRRHDSVGPGIAAGIIGGIALGAIIAGQRTYQDDDGYVYDRPYERCRNRLYERSNGERYWRRVCN